MKVGDVEMALPFDEDTTHAHKKIMGRTDGRKGTKADELQEGISIEPVRAVLKRHCNRVSTKMHSTNVTTWVVN